MNTFLTINPKIPKTDEISKREKEVLEHMSKNLNYKQIAAALFISPLTVKTHINNIYKKLCVNNKEAAIKIWREKYSVQKF